MTGRLRFYTMRLPEKHRLKSVLYPGVSFCLRQFRGRYPSDLGHNFVLAHRECNSAKRDLLASEEHLAAWAQRNRAHGEMLVREFDRLGVLHDLQATESIAYWAYNSESVGGGLTWKARKTLVPLTGEWSHLLLGDREH